MMDVETVFVKISEKIKAVLNEKIKGINNEKGLRKLEKQVRTGKLTKSSINNRGYNKYLKLEGEINVKIDLEKFNQDAQRDGLKRYITNVSLTKEEILEN